MSEKVFYLCIKRLVDIGYMKIAIVGAGFGGLAAAALLAKRGHEVVVFDKRCAVGGRS
ncbi:MAG: FAD-dependent oxidoreductase, partial [Pyrobaculum sp.]